MPEHTTSSNIANQTDIQAIAWKNLQGGISNQERVKLAGTLAQSDRKIQGYVKSLDLQIPPMSSKG